MCALRTRWKGRDGLETSNIAYWTIRIIHDNPLLPLVRNPHKLLKAAGLEQGRKVLEVGCGPGFFTIPAAELVGEKGHVYALDIHPRAVERVKKKIEKKALKNVTALCANASDSGLPGGSVDLAFVFGLRHVAGGLEKVIAELYRVLKPDGILSFEKTKGSDAALIKQLEQGGFTCTGKKGRIYLFTKKGL
jgi:ubiquinone/menaquinone biosynthesis C-methylase UbiE